MCVRRDQDADEDGDVVEEAIRVLVAVTPLERAFVVVVAVVVVAEKRVI